MATTKKALAMAAELVSELAQRQSALTVTQTYDTDGSPLIRVGAAAASSTGTLVPGVLYKIMPLPWPLALDIFGNAVEVFTPHIVKVNIEANYASTVDTIADTNTPAQLLMFLGVALSRGCRTDLYVSAFGTSPNVTDLADATKLVASFDPNLQYKMTSSQ